MFGADAPQAVLAVPGYLRAGDEDGRLLAPFTLLWPEDRRSDGRWAAEAPKRYLAARVAVGTVDQALMAGLQVKHAHLRAAALSRALLVVDEVHASDTYMTEVLKAVVGNHVEAGGRVLLLSATLGSTARSELLGEAVPCLNDALATPYPALSGRGWAPRRVTAGGRAKCVTVETAPIVAAPEAIVARALAAAREGASVLVIRNTVDERFASTRTPSPARPHVLCSRREPVRVRLRGPVAAMDRNARHQGRPDRGRAPLPRFPHDGGERRGAANPP
jgi:CRISPR-associated endonuclease/helicase Cas3